MEREITFYKNFSHPFMTKMADLVKTKDNFPCIIMEKCESSLLDIIENEQELSEDMIIRIITMVSVSLYYIHSCRNVHRDLKPGNILLTFVG